MQRKPLNARLNRKHPHAAGIMAAWAFDRPGNIMREFVSNLQIAAQTGTFGATRTGWGSVGAWTSAGGTDAIGYGDVVDRTLLLPFSIFAIVKPAGSAAQTVTARSGLVSGVNNGFQYKLYWSAGAFGLFRSDGTTSQSALTAASYPAGFVYRVAGTFDGTTARIYVDGALAASVAGSVSVVALASPQLTLASQWVPATAVYNSQFTGQLFGLWILNRAVGANAVASFSADPWAMYRRRPLRIRGINLSGAFTPPDTTPPTVTLISPALGAIASGTPVVIEISSPAGTALSALSVGFYVGGTLSTVDQVWSTSRGFTPLYEANSTLTSVSPNVIQVSMVRQGSWPAGKMRFRPDVVTSAGVVNT